MTRFIAVAVLLYFAVTLPGQDRKATAPQQTPFINENTVKEALREYQAALVITTLPDGPTYCYRQQLCEEPLSPCSTFKIANLCCAVENGIIGSADDILPWDGKKRVIAAWNRDLPVRQAMAVSAVPHFQALATRIGTTRMQQFLDRIHYGNRDISSGITSFWLDGSLRISARQQADVLTRILTGELSLQPATITILKQSLFRAAGKKGRLYGKTGTMADTPTAAPSLGWYVGWIEHD
ncbi:MAG: penicillin-binding transpeptidase domain-containing protein, partial [Victivallales bacterium]|nr:penicillin-binding transpeptidase domain-containing protein [Victivallales bacterium]